MNEQDLQKLKDRYDKYWDSEEINIDLANRIVIYIPKLLNEIDRLKIEAKAQSNAREFAWIEVKRLRSILNDLGVDKETERVLSINNGFNMID